MDCQADVARIEGRALRGVTCIRTNSFSFGRPVFQRNHGLGARNERVERRARGARSRPAGPQRFGKAAKQSGSGRR